MPLITTTIGADPQPDYVPTPNRFHEEGPDRGLIRLNQAQIDGKLIHVV